MCVDLLKQLIVKEGNRGRQKKNRENLTHSTIGTNGGEQQPFTVYAFRATTHSSVYLYNFDFDDLEGDFNLGPWMVERERKRERP